MSKSPFHKGAVVLLGIVSGGFSCLTADILSVTGTTNFTNGPAVGGQNFGVSWSQTSTYTAVSVTALVGLVVGETPSPVAPLEAYLTTSLGTGTTVADEVASVNNLVMPDTPTDLVLFSGLTLGPGTYFLTLVEKGPITPYVWFRTTGAPTVTTDIGVTRGFEYTSPSNLPAYPPGDGPFVYPPINLEFAVTGVQQVVPEPSSLVGAGVLIVCMVFLKRRSAHRSA